MSEKIFMTGIPGYIGKWLVDRLINKAPGAEFTFLIQEKLRRAAESFVQQTNEKYPGFADRARLIPGDISQPALGLSENQYDELADEITHVWHLAAIYDLSVPAAVVYRVNVLGTANILDFCEACQKLLRLDYVSTCYVSGQRKGLILERELDEGQTFKNHYEATKCWAEMEVRRRQRLIPSLIHRPAVVVGDSQSGETDKYDGPYFLLSLLEKIPLQLRMVNVGSGHAEFNIVPVDFLTDAMAELWTLDEALGHTVHLADPAPRTSREIITEMSKLMGMGGVLGTIPPWMIEQALDVKLIREIFKIPHNTIVYLNHDAQHDTSNQRKFLSRSGLRCPDFFSYLPRLIEYRKNHPKKAFLDNRTI